LLDDEEKPEKVHNLIKKENESDPRKILKKTKGDLAHSITKAGLSGIPVIGGPLAEIFSFGVETPLEKRRNNFLIGLDERMKNFEKQKLLSFESLKNNDNFIDIVIHAVQIALRNSSREKINALQNAVINSALKINIDTDSKFMYLNFINELTEIQIKIIKILYEPRSYIEKLFEINKNNIPQGYTYVDVLKDLRKILDVDKVLYDVSIKRLETDGLIDLSDREPGMPIGSYDEHSIWLGKDELERRTKNLVTDFGQIFVKFISDEK